uniref:Uncharacterized protein n=1 Tax=Panagrolaimus superbus TaxID=310955 RepID=A0A914YXA5_9BILA
MPALLQTPPGGAHCTLIQGMYDLTPKAQLTATENSTYISWVQTIEINIIQNAAITSDNEKFLLVAAEMQKLEFEQTVIYSKVEFLNISSWSAFQNVIQISREWTFESSLELILATSASGNCKLFDLLLSASSSDPAKQTALSAFIDTECKPIIANSSKSQKEIIVEIHRKFEDEFFVGAQAQWRAWFYSLKLEGFFAFSQWSDAAESYYKETIYESILEGEGLQCPFILALNKTLSSTLYTPTQKGFIKQLMTYFTQQFTGKTVEQRLTLISMKFSESIDLSYSYFSTLGGITIEGWGNFYDLIIFSCQYQTIPSDCGCVIPTFEPGTGSTIPGENTDATGSMSESTDSITDIFSSATSPSTGVSDITDISSDTTASPSIPSEASTISESSSATDSSTLLSTDNFSGSTTLASSIATEVTAATTSNASESTDFTQSTQASEASSIFTTASIIPSTH